MILDASYGWGFQTETPLSAKAGRGFAQTQALRAERHPWVRPVNAVGGSMFPGF